jgi:hypothetical protein
MAYERSFRKAAWRLALSALVVASGAAQARRGKPVNTPLEAVPAHPRTVVVLAHSWAGSSQSLVAAALDLIQASDLFQKKKSTILWYDDAGAKGGHHVIGSYALSSAASIAQIQTFLRGIDERLDKQQASNARFLRMEILWVEDARVDTPALKLPGPSILGSPFGVDALMATASDQFVQACEQEREDRDLCRAVQKASDKDDSAIVFETKPDSWIGGQFKGGILECWAHAHASDEEILAASVDALLTADVARMRLESRGQDAVRHLAADASDAVSKRRADEVFPLDAPASGKIEDEVKSWVTAVSEKVLKERILPRRAVVYRVEPGTIRGAVVGMRLTGATVPTPIAPVVSVEVLPSGGAPGEPRAFSVSLRVAPPKLSNK